MIVEPITIAERAALLAVATATGLFTADEAESLLGRILDQLASCGLPAGHAALACREVPGGSPVGWTYFAPDPHAEGVWNVWWLGVDPASHGTGAGWSLLRRAEAQAAADGARLMIIETSSKDSQARARRFYGKEGYAECGRIPDFYGEGDDKVIFARRPRAA
ncbi:MAG TPA: GNAT family N-acetyltransferase [Gemmatimonadales bacterium]